MKLITKFVRKATSWVKRDGKYEWLTVTVQKGSGKTPHELRRIAEGEAEAAKAARNRIGVQVRSELLPRITELKTVASQLHEALQGCALRLRIALAEQNGEEPPVFVPPAPSRLENIKAVAAAVAAYEKIQAADRDQMAGA